jgi:hypothetical protein
MRQFNLGGLIRVTCFAYMSLHGVAPSFSAVRGSIPGFDQLAVLKRRIEGLPGAKNLGETAAWNCAPDLPPAYHRWREIQAPCQRRGAAEPLNEIRR